MIKKMDLSGNWAFTLDAEKQGIEQEFFHTLPDDTIELPGTTSIAKKGTPSDAREVGTLTDPYLFEGYAWYAKEISLDKNDRNKNVFLHLERTRLTKVWINDTLVGEQDSLTTPHHYDLTPHIKKNKFRLTILVSNVDYPTRGGHLTSPDTQTNWNGIIGEISLHICDDIYIEHIKTYPDVNTKSVRVEITTMNTTQTQRNLSVCAQAALVDISGETGVKVPAEYFQDIFFRVGKGTAEFTYSLGEDAVLWSEYSPVIYQLQLTIPGTDEKIITTFGLRDFSTTETEFLINGTPTFLRGKHDGLIFPMTGAVPTTVEEWVRVMNISKSYGINHYRFHTCCPPDAAFAAADLLGIYMEPQLPFWGTLTAPGDENHNEEEQQYLVKEGFRMMEAFGNHASYCMMSLGNELWGSKERMAQIITDYRNVDDRHLYTQGSNNFQHTPVLLPEDDFFVGVRFSKNRLFRGSYGMCDAPLGHIQWDEPSTDHNYDSVIHPDNAETENGDGAEEIEIQYGTGVKKVKAADGGGVLIPHIPVVSHEIGQFAVYPNFKEIKKYKGVLKARNFEIFRENLKKKGMLDQAEDFFYTSGMLSVQCYKEELEAAARTKLLAGYQILDIQDFSGQGTALVGILDAFMDSKGHVTPEEWAGYCSDRILLAQFKKYVYSAGETFRADMAIRYYNPEKLENKELHWELKKKRKVICDGTVAIPDGAFQLVQLGEVAFDFPEVTEATTYTLQLTVPDTDMANSYELYCFPTLSTEIPRSGTVLGEGSNQVHITADYDETVSLLKGGKRVLYLPTELADALEGFYCTDFWCYPMFRDICEWMKKPVAVGTMGLLLQEDHPALASFPTHKYATPQWYKIVSHCDCAILDDVTAKKYRPIVQMVDNFERNHKLGILFEGKVGDGQLMICTSRLSEVAEEPEIKCFAKSVLDYVTSDAFAPKQELDIEALKKVFVKEG
ncbi:MAG: beta-glucuronidase [Lachnospiraceae bacterium]|nr:beta-glucuronidase [Lachnospiraceae bacterium]